jgi:hypothetical protein
MEGLFSFHAPHDKSDWEKEDEDDDAYLDVRLQLVEQKAMFWSGGSDYDTDHLGAWGSTSICVTHEESENDFDSLADDLVEDALDGYAQQLQSMEWNKLRELAGEHGIGLIGTTKQEIINLMTCNVKGSEYMKELYSMQHRDLADLAGKHGLKLSGNNKNQVIDFLAQIKLAERG